MKIEQHFLLPYRRVKIQAMPLCKGGENTIFLLHNIVTQLFDLTKIKLNKVLIYKKPS